MDSQARLMRALAVSAAPARDPRFTLAVIEASERERFRAKAALSMLRAAGLTGAAASLAVPFLKWAAANADGLQAGLVAAAGLAALVWASNILARRAGTVLSR